MMETEMGGKIEGTIKEGEAKSSKGKKRKHYTFPTYQWTLMCLCHQEVEENTF